MKEKKHIVKHRTEEKNGLKFCVCDV